MIKVMQWSQGGAVIGRANRDSKFKGVAFLFVLFCEAAFSVPGWQSRFGNTQVTSYRNAGIGIISTIGCFVQVVK